MSDDILPLHPPAGKTRYKVTARDPKQNPFRGRGVGTPFKRADVDSKFSFAEVEQFAREDAKENGFELIKLEVVA